MRFLLYCKNDPRDLGIEDHQGNWNYDRFREHIRACPECARFNYIMGSDLLDNLERAFKQKMSGGEQ